MNLCHKLPTLSKQQRVIYLDRNWIRRWKLLVMIEFYGSEKQAVGCAIWLNAKELNLRDVIHYCGKDDVRDRVFCFRRGFEKS